MKFFPFNLSGPAFLVFYAVLAVAVWLALRRYWRSHEYADGDPIPRLTDPYAIALLRDGAEEAVRLVMISLVDRGLLEARPDGLRAARDAAATARRPIEQAVMRAIGSGAPTDPGSVFADAGVRMAIDRLLAELADQRLAVVPGRNWRWPSTFAALGLLAAVLAWRAWVSGPPLVFLAILGVVALIVIVKAARRRLTALGARTLDHLRVLMRRLRERAPSLRAGGATSEAVLLAAVFGTHVLPSVEFPGVTYRPPQPASDSSSSCGSSGGDGGCGGGGCGGGCGG